MTSPQQSQRSGSEIFVTSVVVSFNRLDRLRTTLTALRSQTRPPDRIIVVDNGSTDGSRNWLRTAASRHREISLLETRTNRGGAGGFALGIAAALDEGTDSLWLTDDDTVPHPDCLDLLLSALSEDPAVPFVAPTVVNRDGALHTRNRPFLDHRIPHALAAAQRGHLSVSAASFVGPLIRAEAALATHLPLDDFFLWHDDTEYTARLARTVPGRQLPSARITHLVGNAGPARFVPGRAVHNIRNLVWCLRESRRADGTSAISPRQWADLLRGILVDQWRHSPARSRPAVVRAAVGGAVAGLRVLPRHLTPAQLLGQGGFTRH
ncbi:Galactofuranosyltransferase GlfT1 [Corynebacterium provencense]|uniref:Galactofuranosyltransferase GlfT1 n=1 Tax=Corynebacterium provencense TaxID=1737425 RepID=A0A2Z3YZF3_9CORY|nr:Galactofuranosyltransferase GlfT1 [Corynebacterium provencense]